MDCAWHPTGRYLAAVGKDGSNLYYYILSVGYTTPASPQALTNSIVFGNAAGGSSSNLKVKLLSGARVEVRGQVFDDA
jgi:hypothetical protein